MVQDSSCLPVVDISHFLLNPNSPESLEEISKLTLALKNFSAFGLKDGRVSEAENGEFLDLMEDYFASDKTADTRPELSYQVGATPSGIELPRCGRDPDCIKLVESLTDENKPLPFDLPDPKWRFFWRMGETPKTTKFKQLNADPVIPANFPQWKTSMDQWGNKMLDAVSVASQMLAVGLDLAPDTFTNLAKNGPHLLAPTGTDLNQYSKVGTVLAGFHTDLNFLTIHGKSRFPGLQVWTPTGQKLQVKIPDGCLLVQAGKQLEYLTGGLIVAGFHEVSILPSTLDAIKRQKERARPLWRISSTLFYHLASDNILEPLDKYKTEETLIKYPSQYVGTQVQKELGLLELSSGLNDC